MQWDEWVLQVDKRPWDALLESYRRVLRWLRLDDARDRSQPELGLPWVKRADKGFPDLWRQPRPRLLYGGLHLVVERERAHRDSPGFHE